MSHSANIASRKLTLLVPSLTGGGAEKVMVRMANHWVSQGNRVTLISLSGTRDDIYPLLPAVERVALDLQSPSRGMLSAAGNNWNRVHGVRSAIFASRPDAVISFVDQMNVLTLLGTIGRRFPVIVSERIDARYHRIGTAWQGMRKVSYRLADCVVVQTEAMAETMLLVSGGGRVEVIANGVDRPRVDLLPMPQRRKVIVAAGRLVEQKGFDLLLEAFAQVAEKHESWNLEIYGTGPQQGRLQSQIQQQGLGRRVTLAGWSSELPVKLAESAVFVMSSRYEGFPNALLDAMAHGAAAVSFACPSGPEEIIRDTRDGLLVEPGQVGAMATALDHLLADLDLQARLGEQAQEVVGRFSYERYFSHWERLLAELIEGQS